MQRFRPIIPMLALLFWLASCTPPAIEPAQTSNNANNEKEVQEEAELTMLPFVTKPQSNQTAEHDLEIGIFYYPWYRNPTHDDGWFHWGNFGDPTFNPPENIASDYYPTLGAYSSLDPAVVQQHFSWMRDAGVNVVISSWWGINSPEDAAVPQLLAVAAEYNMKIAFHIEPYTGRTADSVLTDIQYIYDTYGQHPAFYRTTRVSRWSQNEQNKGLFFLWLAHAPDFHSDFVEPDYWRATVDAVHKMPGGGLIIADQSDARWLDGGHFDGLYNYATVRPADDKTFAWAADLPQQALYIPSVLPGFTGQRLENDLFLGRSQGETYRDQWSAALNTPVEPAMVTITSFNEWHEGTQIEPAVSQPPNLADGSYLTYDGLNQNGYLDLTAELVQEAQAAEWQSWPKLRLRLTTTSDWTTFTLAQGGRLIRPTPVTLSMQANHSPTEDGRELLVQGIEDSQAGNSAELVIDFLFAHSTSGQDLTFEVERGFGGSTQVELLAVQGQSFVIVDSFVWDGVTDGDKNRISFTISNQFSQK